MADQSGKTEQPTQQRLKKAREQGQFPAAKEFVAALQFMVFLVLLGSGGSAWFAQFRQTTTSILNLAFAPELRPEDLIHVAWQVCRQNILPLAMAGVGIAFATVAFRLATTQFGISFKKLMPDPARFNPIARLQDLPKQNLPSLAQAMVLLPVFLWAVWVVARDKLDVFLVLPLQSVESGFRLIASSLMELFWKAAAVFLIFGCVDLARQLRKHKSELRMSKQEIREEMKDAEGNPQIKARIRRLQRDRVRRRRVQRERDRLIRLDDRIVDGRHVNLADRVPRLERRDRAEVVVIEPRLGLATDGVGDDELFRHVARAAEDEEPRRRSAFVHRRPARGDVHHRQRDVGAGDRRKQATIFERLDERTNNGLVHEQFSQLQPGFY